VLDLITWPRTFDMIPPEVGIDLPSFPVFRKHRECEVCISIMYCISTNYLTSN